jgi:hypothetical protein
MSVSYYVEGIREPDEEFQKMKKIYDLCIESDVGVPREVEDYFDGNTPDNDGLSVEIPNEEFSEEYRSGYKVQVKDIPKNIKCLKFTISC